MASLCLRSTRCGMFVTDGRQDGRATEMTLVAKVKQSWVDAATML